MKISAENMRFDNDSMWISLSDGRTLGVPLAWFPRLLKASPEHLEDYTISQYGLHWGALDEDVSIEGLLSGKGGQIA